MNISTITILTPPGVGAIACLAVAGPKAWEIILKHFRPGGKTELPETPPTGRFWYGTFGREGQPGDEVILAVKPHWFEIHCHGGLRVVRWIVGIFLEGGFVERTGQRNETSPWDLLSRTPTARTASVLLDQCRGAFAKALEQILVGWPASSPALGRLAALVPLGRHLVEPWRVVIAGPPNVGKSSLLNALAGYTRSIVAPVKGTTRDVVTAVLAFDGWPVELSDTAGLHESTDVLESAGMAKAEEQLRIADLVLWVKDATEAENAPPPNASAARIPSTSPSGGEVKILDAPPPDASVARIPSTSPSKGVVKNVVDSSADAHVSALPTPYHTHLPTGGGGRRASEASTAGGGEIFPPYLTVWNKCDLATHPTSGLAVSAHTREGIPELIATIVSRLVPHEPQPLEAVPYTSHLADRIEQAWISVQTGNLDAARASLSACLAELETNSDSM